jgi:hypothetical protein
LNKIFIIHLDIKIRMLLIFFQINQDHAVTEATLNEVNSEKNLMGEVNSAAFDSTVSAPEHNLIDVQTAAQPVRQISAADNIEKKEEPKAEKKFPEPESKHEGDLEEQCDMTG